MQGPKLSEIELPNIKKQCEKRKKIEICINTKS